MRVKHPPGFTVRTHIYNMYRKLGVTSRTELLALVNKQAQPPGKTRYSSTAKLFLPVAFASYMARSARWMRAFASKFSTFSW